MGNKKSSLGTNKIHKSHKWLTHNENSGEVYLNPFCDKCGLNLNHIDILIQSPGYNLPMPKTTKTQKQR